MRIVQGLLFAGFFFCLGGCDHFTRSTQPSAGLRIASAAPSAQDLVAAINDNARKVQALDCRDVELDCSQADQPVGLTANMICQRPRNFRMQAKVVGNTAVDIGSNDREFWWWISKATPPYQYHCSYQDLASGQIRLQFPFQPDWIMESLGMAEYDPSKAYEVAPDGPGLDLVERSTSPQGQPVRKVTRLANNRGQWQVTAHLLQDASGREICSAYIGEYHFDTASGAVLPRRLKLVWPAERVEMKMRLNRMVVNPNNLSPDRVAALFNRENMPGVQSFDLARGLDAPGSALQPAGAFNNR